MARYKHSSHLRALPKMWVLHLLCLLRAKLWELNAQLTLPPDPAHVFEFRKWPKPLDRSKAPRTFEQAIDRGNFPDSAPYKEPDDSGEYNLFVRVAQYVEFSEDWLFKELVPYLAPTLPDVAYSSALINQLLQRLSLRRMSADATKFALHTSPKLVRRKEAANFHALGENPDPIHLMLLIALFHERQWHFPFASETKELDLACCRAVRNFTCRDEFTWSEEARAHQEGISSLFWSVIRAIRHRGHRSKCSDTSPNVPDLIRFWCSRSDFFNVRRCVICEPFEHFDAADLCASLGHALPISHLLFGEPTVYSEYALPTIGESTKALSDLISAGTVQPARWLNYDRDPSVLMKITCLS